MNKFETLTTMLVAVLGGMSIVMPFVIEFTKNLIGEAKIITKFGKLEKFCAFITAIISVVVYVFLFVLVPEYYAKLNIAQIIVVGIIFSFACSMGSQIGYDKIIKWIIRK